MKIVFFGTSSFAAHILTDLLKKHFNVVAVVTKPDRPRGRSSKPSPPEVKKTLSQIAPFIPIHQPDKASTETFAHILSSYHPDLFIVVAYGEIIRSFILSIPTYGCINIHASLLPKFRGAAPIERAIMAGEKETGITIIEMSPKMDAGDMLASIKTPILPNMNGSELEMNLRSLACEILEKVIRNLEKGTIKKISQDHQKATFAPKITPFDCEIDWKQSAVHIHNQIRALSPKPGAWCEAHVGKEIKRLKIQRSRIEHNLTGSSGEIISYDKTGWIVACGEGAIRLEVVQLEGKKALAAKNFIKGMPNISFVVN